MSETQPPQLLNGKLDMRGDTALLVGEVIREFEKKIASAPAPVVTEMPPFVQAIAEKMLSKVPTWIWGLIAGGVVAYGTQLAAIWGLPSRVDAIERNQQTQGTLLERVACKVGAGHCNESTSQP